MFRVFFCVFLLSILLATPSFAAVSFQPAFKTLGVWDSKTKVRVDVNIWYPTHSRPSPSNYAPWTLHVVRYGRSAEGRFPLILLSHDTGATRFSHHETAAELAKSGFVVIAPDHKNDNLNHISHPFTIKQLTGRVQELRAALNIGLSNEAISKSVDSERVGVLGFGMGASAALLLGNATLTPTGWDNYCTQVRNTSLYCGKWARERIQTMANALPLNENLAEEHIKSVVAVSPSLNMFFDNDALINFSPDLLLIEAAKDSVNNEPWTTQAMQEKFFQETNFARIEGVDTPDLMSACPPDTRQSLPELCGDASSAVRRKAHQELNTAIIKFFLETLGRIRNP